jgi:hypothetical protein
MLQIFDTLRIADSQSIAALEGLDLQSINLAMHASLCGDEACIAFARLFKN